MSDQDQISLILGSDHGGFELKQLISTWLSEQGYTVSDLGATALDDGDDYPDYAFPVAEQVAQSNAARGILFCRSGAGMMIAANKVAGARAFLAHSPDEVAHARQHNNANIIVFAADWMDQETVKKCIETFLKTEFSNAERHMRRIGKIVDYEKRT